MMNKYPATRMRSSQAKESEASSRVINHFIEKFLTVQAEKAA